MIHAYDDEDNAPMSEDLPSPYRIRTWEEVIKEWEGEHDADGQGQVSGGLEADRDGSEGEIRMDLPGLRNAVPETRGTVRHTPADADGSPYQPHPGGLPGGESDRAVRRMPSEGGRGAPRGKQEET